MTGEESEPFATVRPAVHQPVRQRRRWWLVIAAATSLLILGATAAALGLRDDYNNGALFFCISDDVAAAIHDETLALVPANATGMTSRVSDCDDRRATTVQFTDTSSDEATLFQAAARAGWTRATPTCSEKQISGRSVHLKIDVVAAPDPSAGQWSLYASPGSC